MIVLLFSGTSKYSCLYVYTYTHIYIYISYILVYSHSITRKWLPFPIRIPIIIRTPSEPPLKTWTLAHVHRWFHWFSLKKCWVFPLIDDWPTKKWWFFPIFSSKKTEGCRDAVEPRAWGDHLRCLGPLRRGLAGTEARGPRGLPGLSTDGRSVVPGNELVMAIVTLW